MVKRHDVTRISARRYRGLKSTASMRGPDGAGGESTANMSDSDGAGESLRLT
jgi:hypothetical protein